MTKTKFTTEKWQSTFKSGNKPVISEVPTENEPEEFDARLNRIIGYAETIGTREYQLSILSVLYQIDRANASVQSELIRKHCPEEIYLAFSDVWGGLKRMIWEIENREEKCETSTTTT